MASCLSMVCLGVAVQAAVIEMDGLAQGQCDDECASHRAVVDQAYDAEPRLESERCGCGRRHQ